MSPWTEGLARVSDRDAEVSGRHSRRGNETARRKSDRDEGPNGPREGINGVATRSAARVNSTRRFCLVAVRRKI